MNPRYQTTCAECDKVVWIVTVPETHCPECGAKLPEVSSEDGSDGEFESERNAT